jgi:hypothetical protein
VSLVRGGLIQAGRIVRVVWAEAWLLGCLLGECLTLFVILMVIYMYPDAMAYVRASLTWAVILPSALLFLLLSLPCIQRSNYGASR